MAEFFRQQQQAATEAQSPATGFDAQTAPGTPGTDASGAPDSETTEPDTYGIIPTPTEP
jgi:hypothetical protein